MRETIDHIIIEEHARDAPLAGRFARRFPEARITYCSPDERSTVCRTGVKSPKRAVYLAHHRGSFLKPFPRHPWYGEGGGCHHNLILGYNCFASCRYCFIQTIFDHPVPTMYVNSVDMIAEVETFLAANTDAMVSTGEYVDSFQLDEVTGHTETLMSTLDRFPASTLELRTKSGRVDHLPDNPSRGVLVSYSINPPEVVKTAEPGTIDVISRLSKARLLHLRGYRIALRVDPIIPVDGFLLGYQELPALVEEHLGWERVTRVFLGMLRFDDALLKTMSASLSGRRLLDADYARCPDGHYRPFRHRRIETYRLLTEAIRRYAPDIEFSVTMEPDYVRRAVL